MKRDISKLGSECFDVVVVGGGVHGATISCHAAQAGYRTALVEKNDFCGATSANSLKILHGGLRYLQHGNIKRMRHSIAARREMMQMAPHLVKPLPCIMPIYGRGLRSVGVMKAALFVNDCIGWDRNQGLQKEGHLPRGHVVSKKKCLEVVPGIAPHSLHGGAVWYDALAVNTERLVLEYILKSVEYGAVAANYAQVISVVKGEDDFYKVTVLDRLGNQSHCLKARCIVNASGPWFEGLLGSANPASREKQDWALALNIISRKKIFDGYAVALEGQSRYEDKDALIQRGKRLYFFVPWRGYTMIGTEYEKSSADPDSLGVRREIVQNMVDEVNAIYPPAQLQFEDISFFHAGLLPRRGGSESATVQLEKNSTFIEHRENGFPGVLSVKGVKYTTAPGVAREVTGFLRKQFSPEYEREREQETTKSHASLIAEYPAVYTSLEKKYGKRAANILVLLSPSDENLWIDEASQLLKAEVQYLVADEMACTLADVVFRRTGLGSAECPQQQVLVKLAAFMGELLGWDRVRQEKEIDEVVLRYAPLVIHEFFNE